MGSARNSHTPLPLALLLSAGPFLTGCTRNLAEVSSGEVGCPTTEITISDYATGGLGRASWVATCRGQVFYCSSTQIGDSHQYQCAPALGTGSYASRPAAPAAATPAAPVAAPQVEEEEKPFPEKALGFEFASAPAQAQETCTSRGHEWKGEGNTFACSGAGVDVGVPVNTKLSYCDGSLCEIRGFATLSSGGAGSQQLAKLRKALVTQYGTPDDEESQIPQECQKSLMSCIVEKKAAWGSTWEWDDGAIIRARAGTDGQAAVIGILYRRDAEAQKAQEAAESLNTDAF